MRWQDYAYAVIGPVVILAGAWWVLNSSVPTASAAEACRNMVASYYGAESGSRTADGSFFDGTQLVAAHKTMKFGTKLRVTYRGKTVVVTVRDRGPFIKGRELDLSKAAAQRIGMITAGVATVRVCKL